MRIVPPPHFRNATELRDPNAAANPHSLEFRPQSVEIDLSDCSFIHVPAAMWCLTYALVAQRRSQVLVRLPSNPDVLRWLEAIDFPRILVNAGVEVAPDQWSLPTQLPKVVLPLTRFDRESDAEQVVQRADESLMRLKLGVANIRPFVGQAFSELAMNAVQHSSSPVAAYGFIQFHEYANGPQFECGIADGGIGIPESLRRNRALTVPHADAQAVDLALNERITGTPLANRGIGLHWLKENMVSPGRLMIMHSMLGMAYVNGDGVVPRNVRLFPGTLGYVKIPT